MKMILFASGLIFNFIVKGYTQNADYYERLQEIDPLLHTKEADRFDPLYGLQAPTFAAINQESDSIWLDEFKNQVVVLYFTSIHCRPCMANVENMNDLVFRYTNKPVKFIAFTSDKKRSLVLYQQKKKYLDFEIIPDSYYLWKKTYGLYPYGTPTLMILDRAHKVRFIKMGGKLDPAKNKAYTENKIIPIIDQCL